MTQPLSPRSEIFANSLSSFSDEQLAPGWSYLLKGPIHEYPSMNKWVIENGPILDENGIRRDRLIGLHRYLLQSAESLNVEVSPLTLPTANQFMLMEFQIHRKHFKKIEIEEKIQKDKDRKLLAIWEKLPIPQEVKEDIQGDVARVREWLTAHPIFNNVLDLNLSKLGLTEIPQEFTALQFPELRKLKLNNNRIREIPQGWLQRHPMLSRIEISFNEIEIIPEGFLQFCPKLTNISLYKNKIRGAIPATFCRRVENLFTLDLSKNQIESLPDNFLINSKRLQTINLMNNQLRTIPTGFCQYTEPCRPSLTVWLQNNQIETIAPNLFNCDNRIGIIRLDNNRLQTYPVGFAQGCTGLTSVDLRNNPLPRPAPDGFLSECPLLSHLLL